MVIYQNISLKPYNTFGIDVNASHFVRVNTVEELQVLCTAFNLSERNKLVFGGGSNLLLTKDFDGMAVKIDLKGIDKIKEDEEHVWIKAMSGEVWHHLVLYSVEHNWGGLENLSLIPGCVGAAPMQNIGAYGVEIKDTFEELFAIEIESGKLVKFTNAECKFGYRESVFKNEEKNKFIIVSVTFKLTKNPKINISYGAIQETLNKKGITQPSIKDVSDAVIEIRKSKLPDPKDLGNSGSFFKNPEIELSLYESLKVNHPTMPGYPVGSNKIKVPAGWLIEQCGFKGKRIGNTGSHKDQALVLVNYGGATGNEIYQLALTIQETVKEKFGIQITPEVNIL
ncbi:MAG: UDP-N-acetylmuramate dehydrogenase [Bacteroidia bacterium]|nr:UDP-N-acetylmuramate dehydrogenase [Bacteroidia bacterium]